MHSMWGFFRRRSRKCSWFQTQNTALWLLIRVEKQEHITILVQCGVIARGQVITWGLRGLVDISEAVEEEESGKRASRLPQQRWQLGCTTFLCQCPFWRWGSFLAPFLGMSWTFPSSGTAPLQWRVSLLFIVTATGQNDAIMALWWFLMSASSSLTFLKHSKMTHLSRWRKRDISPAQQREGWKVCVWGVGKAVLTRSWKL